jgi:hypothetical protein
MSYTAPVVGYQLSTLNVNADFLVSECGECLAVAWDGHCPPFRRS